MLWNRVHLISSFLDFIGLLSALNLLTFFGISGALQYRDRGYNLKQVINLHT